MIKFLQLLTIDRPVLSFLFANACSSILLLVILSFFNMLISYINYYFYAFDVGAYFYGAGITMFGIIILLFRSFFLIVYCEVLLKNKQNNYFYKLFLSLKSNNIFKIELFFMLLFFEFIFFMLFQFVYDNMLNDGFYSFSFLFIFIFAILLVNNFLKNKNLNVLKFIYLLLFFALLYWFVHLLFLYKRDIDYILIVNFPICSLALSYLMLIVFWFIKDMLMKLLEIIRRIDLLNKIFYLIEKIKDYFYYFLNRNQIIVFILSNILCCSYVCIYLIAKIYNSKYNLVIAPFWSGRDNIIEVLFLNYIYQIIRYILIFKVFDIFSKMESGQVVDFIKKLKTSSKCRKVTSIVLFSIDTLFILLLSRGTSCNHCFIYWIMSYFFGLMSMYFVMFYYWHLENKHKDVLAEVDVKEDTGVV